MCVLLRCRAVSVNGACCGDGVVFFLITKMCLALCATYLVQTCFACQSGLYDAYVFSMLSDLSEVHAFKW